MNPIRGWLADARQNPDTRHVDTCDGVRALAILIVAWYHIWQQSWLYPNLTIGGKTVSFDPFGAVRLYLGGYHDSDQRFLPVSAVGAADRGRGGAKPAGVLRKAAGRACIPLIY